MFRDEDTTIFLIYTRNCFEFSDR